MTSKLYKLGYSINEAAKVLGISRSLMRAELSNGYVFHTMFGARVVIPRWALDERLARPAPTVVVPMERDAQ